MVRNAVGYCRVSTKGQTGDDSFGIESQKAMIEEYCEANGLNLVKIYVDEAVSGASSNRPELSKLINGEISNPPIKYLVVAKADRISRDVALYYGYKARLKDMHIDIISVKEDWSTQDKLTAMILENFMAVVAQIERENIKVRMSGGRKQKARVGGYAGGACPFGYSIVNGRYVIKEEEAKIVRIIFDLRRNKGYTMQAIRDYLNANGYLTKRGKTYQISGVQYILGNERTYRGEYKYGDGGWVKGQHEPILTD